MDSLLISTWPPYSIFIVVVVIILSPLSLLGCCHRLGRLVLAHKNITPRRPLLSLPPATNIPLLVPHHAQCPRVVITRIRGRLEAKTPFDLQARVASQIADIPEGVGLTLEQCDDNGTTGSEAEQGAFEELDEQFLIVAHLPIDVGGFAANMGKIKNYGRKMISWPLVLSRRP